MSHPRVVNVRHRVPYDVYVGRPNARYGLPGSKWANPYKGRVRNADGSVTVTGRRLLVDRYRVYIESTPHLQNSVQELRGKILACWCAPALCHADVLAELADGGAS